MSQKPVLPSSVPTQTKATALAKLYVVLLVMGATVVGSAAAYSFLPFQIVEKLPRIDWLDRLRPSREGLVLGHQLNLPEVKLPDPLLLAEEGSDSKLDSQGPLVGQCADGLLDKAVKVPNNRIGLLIREGSLLAFFTDDSICLRKGQSVFVVTHEAKEAGPEVRLRASAQVRSLQASPYREFLKSPLPPGVRDTLQKLMAEEGGIPSLKTIVIADLKLNRRFFGGFSLDSILAPWAPHTKVVGRGDLARLNSQKALILDARPQHRFATEVQIDGAQNWPGPLTWIAPGDPREAGFTKRLFEMTNGLESPLVIYDSGPHSRLAFRAGAVAYRAGYRKVYWFWEGADALTGNSVFLPESIGNITSLTGPELIKATRSSVLVDVRSRDESVETGLPDSIHVPYRLTWQSAQVRRPDQQSAWLRKMGDSLDTSEIPKNRSLIIFGQDRGDWRAVKAALLLRDSGFNDVRYALGGVADFFEVQ